MARHDLLFMGLGAVALMVGFYKGHQTRDFQRHAVRVSATVLSYETRTEYEEDDAGGLGTSKTVFDPVIAVPQPDDEVRKVKLDLGWSSKIYTPGGTMPVRYDSRSPVVILYGSDTRLWVPTVLWLLCAVGLGGLGFSLWWQDQR